MSLSSHEVATLVGYLGNAMEAVYYPSYETMAPSSNAINWMNTYGGLHATPLKEFDETAIVNAIIENKLVYGRGQEIGALSGHAWVYDGYIKAQKGSCTPQYMLHCNWGWDGQRNGYYLSKVFNTYAGAQFPDNKDEDSSRSYYFNNNLEYSIVSK